ncbi:general secretion pathway protein G [Heliophilum fasciatum]|uniref:General secretion pathway protein G n=1 Tax=Heliophilum fasciatum TaxID=35700 RepID=A0A4R2RUZ4_9FIRM|nr:general secretion pathway protein G [Heliophilum fasciatum]
MRKKSKKGQEGFSLIEILIVVAVIGVLAAMIVPSAFSAVDKGKVATLLSDYRAVKSAVLNYYTDVGSWPAESADGTGLVGKPATSPATWSGPYLERWPTSPWENVSFEIKKITTGTAPNTETKYILEIDKVPAEVVNKIYDELGSATVTKSVSDEVGMQLLLAKVNV